MTDEFFELMFNGAPHPYLVLRPDIAFTIVGVNERYLAATGTERTTILGRGLFEVFPDNPEDASASGVSDLRMSLDRVKRERAADVMGVQKYDIPAAKPDGAFEVKYWSPVNTPVLDASGRLAYIIHHVEDVTEFMLIRERASLESSEHIEEVKARANRMEAEVLQRASEVKEANRRIKAAMEEVELRKTELVYLNDQLKDLDRAKTAFFSNVSHEFRTPLMLMLGSVEEALGDATAGLAAPQRERLVMARRNTLRLLKLVNTLLEFSRIEAGRERASFKPTDLATVTTQLASHFQSVFDAAGLDLILDCPALPEPAFVDPDMWEKIVLNLVSNAFKFTLRGSVTVVLQALDGNARLTVRDTGTGIPEHELPNLFKRFHRVEGTEGRSFEGSGIGLALVQEAVKLHGGVVSVKSVHGQGSEFHVSIPLGSAHLPTDRIQAPHSLGVSAARAEASVDQALSWLPGAEVRGSLGEEDSDGAYPAADFDSAGTGRPRVVLADDNSDMRSYIGRLLDQAGYQVTAVTDGIQALESCLGNPPNLVLSDVMMPRLDGFALVDRLRKDARTASLPIILISARAGEQARIEGLEAGADDYVVKPFGSRELLARVDGAVRLARARSSAAIREIELTRMRASFEDAAVGIAHVGPDGRWLRVNDRVCAIVGYARDELLAKTFQDITHPDDLSADLSYVQQLLAGEIATYHMEKRYIHKEGQIIWVKLTVSLVCTVDGRPDYFVSVIDDVTARQQAEINLAESRNRLAGIVTSAMDAIISVDEHRRVVLFNGAAERMFQRTASEAIGQPLDQLLPERFRAAHASYIDSFVTTGVSTRAMGKLGTLSGVRADGHEFPIEASISKIRIAGQSVLTVILRDISARKLAEEQQAKLLADVQRSETEARQQKALQQSIFESTPDGMVLTDLDRNIIHINPAFTEVFGYELSDLSGLPSRRIYATDADCDLVGRHIAAGKNGDVTQPLNCLRKNGDVFPVQMTGAKLLGAGGTAIGYLGVYRDITQELKRDQALREKQRLQALGRLTGGVAHDFNNLLTVISGNIQLVDMTLQDERMKRYLAEAYRATEMGARLNQRLMTFARQRQLEPVTLNLNDLVNALLDLVRRSIGESIRVKTNLAASPANVLVDASEMESALLNLALNARDAMPDGGCLLLETRNVEIDGENASASGGLPSGPYIYLAVSDTGAGMSPEVMSRAFEPFFTTKDEGKGTGLGLTTIHGFVRQSGGNVTLYSELGHGTTVNIYLPSLARIEPKPVNKLPENAQARGRGETILVVEDNDAVRKLTCERLRILGYSVIEAENGIGALAIAAGSDQIDLVFSDIIMPGGISGFELAKRLRATYPKLKLLLTSGFPDEIARFEAPAGEQLPILRKPYSQEDLARSVASALAQVVR